MMVQRRMLRMRMMMMMMTMITTTCQEGAVNSAFFSRSLTCSGCSPSRSPICYNIWWWQWWWFDMSLTHLMIAIFVCWPCFWPQSDTHQSQLSVVQPLHSHPPFEHAFSESWVSITSDWPSLVGLGRATVIFFSTALEFVAYAINMCLPQMCINLSHLTKM